MCPFVFLAESFFPLSLSLFFSIGEEFKNSRRFVAIDHETFFAELTLLVFAIPLFFADPRTFPPSITYFSFAGWGNSLAKGGKGWSRCLTLSVYQVVFALLPLYFLSPVFRTLCVFFSPRFSRRAFVAPFYIVTFSYKSLCNDIFTRRREVSWKY